MPLDIGNLKQYKNVTVMGIGRFGGGAGAVRFFAGLGARVTATDLAPAARLAPSLRELEGLENVTFILGEHRSKDFELADLVVANQAVRPDNPLLEQARAARVPVTTETGLALALNRSPWLGVTGSSGKSTTASLLAAMLSESDPGAMLGGNIGGDLITRIGSHGEASPLVVELSSFQLSYLKDDFAAGLIRPPKVSLVTNLAPNHLDWHRSEEEYYTAKRSLLLQQRQDDWTILNADDPRLTAWAVSSPARAVYCARVDPDLDDACFLDQDGLTLRLGGKRALHCSLERFRLPGPHNRMNAAMAAAAAFVFGSGAEAIQRGLEKFESLPHRLRTIAEIEGRLFVDDSKSTTPEAAVTALDSFEQPVVLIAGGYDKFAPFEQLADAAQRSAAGLVLIGQAGERLGREVRKASARRSVRLGELPIVEAGDDFIEAVREAYRLTPEGGVVLLSPGCASYGMFVNYEERGKAFRHSVTALSDRKDSGRLIANGAVGGGGEPTDAG